MQLLYMYIVHSNYDNPICFADELSLGSLRAERNSVIVADEENIFLMKRELNATL